MKLAIPIVLFLVAIPGCRERPLAPAEGPMPLNDGSVTRYVGQPAGMTSMPFVRWRQGEVFIKPSERIRPLEVPTCDVFDSYVEKAVAHGTASPGEPFSASAIVVSLDPDLVVLCIWHTPGDKRPLPFGRWARSSIKKEWGGINGVKDMRNVNSLCRMGWNVGSVVQNTKHVILINSEGDARELHFDAIGDSIDVFSDEEVTIQFTRVSKHTIRCFRIEKGDEGEKDEDDAEDALGKSLLNPKTKPGKSDSAG